MAATVLTSDDLEPVLGELRAIRAEIAALSDARRAEPVTLEEAARHWGVSSRTMRRWVKSGQVPSVRVGGTLRVRLDAAGPTR